ncbi:uncharacterized protein LOC135846312 isoform X2 [Planococcus citri]|uniref:uncharacterized protein LOC135846312 isoform X2 n=1 Tax=Planococcus citri TaxID=170843 RepID=UPI0031F8FD73
MIGRSSVLLTILIAYLAYSYGVMIPYKNNTFVYYSWKENISITCTDDVDEVTWTHFFAMGANYSIKVETPHRKVFKIKNASFYNTGMYDCVSTKNRNEFMRIYLNCDESCKKDPTVIWYRYISDVEDHYKAPAVGETHAEITN